MIILVCGGRDYTDRLMMNNILKEYAHQDSSVIISGGATGADTLAIKWARANNVKYKVYMADWKQYGKQAGFIRNQYMLEDSNPDLVIAFPGGRGTADMIKRARKKQVYVVEV